MSEASAGSLVVVDLSNLARDIRLLQPGMGADARLVDQFMDALRASGIAARAIWVADRSLPPLLDVSGKRRLRELERSGDLEYSSLADERILEIALGHDARPGTFVASMDNFDDFRRSYPAIQGSTDRFIGWEKKSDRSISLYLREMGVHSHHRLSRKEESAELKARRLHRVSVVRRAAATHFRCNNDQCLLARLWPDRLPELPRYNDRTDRFVCPTCGEGSECWGTTRAVRPTHRLLAPG